MATESSYTLAPLSPETWPAFDALVQRHNGIFGGCWCIWFHPDGPERGQGAEANRALKKAYVDQGKAHAALGRPHQLLGGVLVADRGTQHVGERVAGLREAFGEHGQTSFDEGTSRA